LFALTSWNLALWVTYFAEEGVGLTTKQDEDKVSFNRKHCTRLQKCCSENKTLFITTVYHF